jgi:hypothetical protein
MLEDLFQPLEFAIDVVDGDDVVTPVENFGE